MTEFVPGLDSGPSATMYNPLQLITLLLTSLDCLSIFLFFLNRVTSLNINCPPSPPHTHFAIQMNRYDLHPESIGLHRHYSSRLNESFRYTDEQIDIEYSLKLECICLDKTGLCIHAGKQLQIMHKLIHLWVGLQTLTEESKQKKSTDSSTFHQRSCIS